MVDKATMMPGGSGSEGAPPLRMIAWEVTRACNLVCVHCRAEAICEPPPGEWTTEEAYDFLDQVASFAKPVIILTGGDPMMRKDIWDIARHGTGLGLRMVISPNGTLITPETPDEMKGAGIMRVSISIDGSSPEIHDKFRGVPGAFEGALRGISYLRDAGIGFQINTTVTKHNLDDLEGLLELVHEIGADAWHVFLLVPTGRAKDMKEQEITPEQYEETLNWLYEVQRDAKIYVKPTCAPHYYRIYRQRAKKDGLPLEPKTQSHGLQSMTRGCLGGITFMFVSHMGDAYPCGYLEALGGNVRELGVEKVWKESEVFQRLRDYAQLEGRCGACEYVRICGGCRARANAIHGDYMAEEPYCVYEPKKMKLMEKAKERP